MNEKLPEIVKNLMNERFNRDSIIALATSVENIPHVRTVNGYYENGAFYVITHALSNKMKQIEINPHVAVSGEWFTAHGRASNLGWFCKNENRPIAARLRKAFESWIDNGHNDFDNENTCILRIELTDGVLLSHGTKYEVVFSED